jgi:MoaA/NifB/PqqE/SkfB family radical SAM enzyme
LRKCNLSCTGCTTLSDHSESASFPPVTNWIKDLTLLKNNVGPEILGIAGGEPLMHPDIQQIVEFARKTFSKVHLSTNGLLLSDHSWLHDLISDTEEFILIISVHGDTSKDNKFSDMLHNSVTQFLAKSTNMSVDLIKNTIDDFSANGADASTDNFYVVERNQNIVKIKGTNILLRFTSHYWVHPYLDDQSLPIPYDNNAQDAFRDCFCPLPHYVDGKIFKCPVTAFLPDMLNLKGNINKWPHLKEFIPYDIQNIDNDEITRLQGPEDVCKHCPVNNKDQRVRNIKKDDKSKLYIIRSG